MLLDSYCKSNHNIHILTVESCRTLVLVTVDFVELLNQTSGDLSIAHGLNLTDLYNVATQDQDVFLEEYGAYSVVFY